MQHKRPLVVLSALLLGVGCPDRSGRSLDPEGDDWSDAGPPPGPSDANVIFVVDASWFECSAPPPNPDDCVVLGGGYCFDPPSAPLAVASGDPAVIGCEVADGWTGPRTFTARVVDLQDDEPVGGAVVELFADGDLGAPDLTATADAAGAFTLAVPDGTTVRPITRTRHPDAVDTLEWFGELEADRQSVSLATVDAMPAFIGQTVTPGLGLIIVRALDCMGRPVAHAVAALSYTPTGSCPDFTSYMGPYYFTCCDTNLPSRRSLVHETTANGLALIIEAPPTADGEVVWVQVWGFATEADVAAGRDGLRLLGTVARPVVAGAVEFVDVYTTGLETPGP